VCVKVTENNHRRSHLTSFFIHYVGITDCRKLKSMILEYTPNGIISIQNSIQIQPAVLKLNHVDRHEWGI
jgi:hypothetical protein